MNFEKLTFNDSGTQRVYENYMKRVQKVVETLPHSDKHDVLMEINSHIFEGMQQPTPKSEINHLLDILENLGSPEEVLQPLVVDKKKELAAKPFNPFIAIKNFVFRIPYAIYFMVVCVLYTCLFCSAFLIIGKLLFPNYVGLYYKKGEMAMLGATYLSNQPYEMLGNWLIPLMMLSFAIFYLVIKLLERLETFFQAKNTKIAL